MPEVNAKILALVERELKKDRYVQSTELQAKALKIDKSVGALSGRQFHARYALQARRRLFGGARSASGGNTRPVANDANPVKELVADSYKRKRAALDAAVGDAFARAIKADSIGGVNKLLSALDRHARELEKV